MTEADRASVEWTTWGYGVRVVVTDADRLVPAENLARGYLAAVDAATNAERSDSEIAGLAAGPNRVTPLLARFVTEAMATAELTDGYLCPTPGTPDWRSIRVDGDLLDLPDGASLDLTATTRAAAADYVAEQISGLLECGVLVGLGGDIATAGTAPEGGWQIRVRDLPGDPSCQIAVPAGAAVATSSTVTPLHPDSIPLWRTASVVEKSCARAHAVASSALRRAGSAVDWVSGLGVPTRLVDQEMRIVTLSGWPAAAR